MLGLNHGPPVIHGAPIIESCPNVLVWLSCQPQHLFSQQYRQVNNITGTAASQNFNGFLHFEGVTDHQPQRR